MNNRQFNLLNAFRGIAAFGVVMCHAFPPLRDDDAVNPSWFFKLLSLTHLWGELGVVMFFIISGYCITGVAQSVMQKNGSLYKYLVDRLRRIYPCYFAAVVLALSLEGLIALGEMLHVIPSLHADFLSRDNWGKSLFWVSNIFLFQVEAGLPSLLIVAWTLCYEIFFYITVGFTLFLLRIMKIKQINQPILFLSILLGLTLISLCWLCLNTHCPFPLDLSYQFGLGAMLFYLYNGETWPIRRISAGGLICFAVLALLVGYLNRNDFLPVAINDAHPGVLATASVLFVGLLALLKPFDHHLSDRFEIRPLMWLGTISYSLYLIHPLIIPTINFAGRHLGFDHHLYWVTYLAQFAASIVFGWLFFLLVERRFVGHRSKTQLIPKH